MSMKPGIGGTKLRGRLIRCLPLFGLLLDSLHSTRILVPLARAPRFKILIAHVRCMAPKVLIAMDAADIK